MSCSRSPSPQGNWNDQQLFRTALKSENYNKKNRYSDVLPLDVLAGLSLFILPFPPLHFHHLLVRAFLFCEFCLLLVVFFEITPPTFLRQLLAVLKSRFLLLVSSSAMSPPPSLVLTKFIVSLIV